MDKSGWPAGTEALLDEIVTDAYGDDEQLWALRQEFEDNVLLPAGAFVVGEPVEVIEIDYDGNARVGLVATCRRPGGGEHAVATADLCFPEGSDGARYVAAYRRWLGLEPAAERGPAARRRRRHKATADDLQPGAPVELVVLATKENAARCRILGTERELTLRSGDISDTVSGEIVTVRVAKQWRYAGHPYLSGSVEDRRLEVGALGLVPLPLQDRGPWDPAEQYWGEEGEPLQEWAKPIVARGPRPSFEMERMAPGADPADLERDPILEAIELRASGDAPAARRLLGEMLAADLRCLDAHAHLGAFAFRHRPEAALRHYEAGFRIGELSLGADFDGVLPWGCLDNRPFVRCMHGFGLCLWRLRRLDEAKDVLKRMLWLNPTDNQGIRFLLPEVSRGERWADRHERR